ncbi:MAG: nicotinate-nucleotide diphosphorylase (carboxylating) [Deltaproteobacteria bacterium]|nr:nicotinate-nucleotide diphosphorylase (carboxylating) [Deltaproteobacteria bacterium]
MHTTSTDALIRLALDEDIGTGDRTTLATIESDARAEAVVIAKEPLVLAGVPYFARVFELMQADLEVQATAPEGSLVDPGVTVVTLRGNARDLLIGERTALNILQRLSGIATLTRRFVDAISGTSASIVDTRKTAPGMRSMAKYAVVQGGGSNHRFGLDSGIMVKDNHIASCGSLTEAVRRVRAASPHLLKIEVEVTNPRELEEALEAQADVILLDNMSTEELRAAVEVVASRPRRPLLEASGNLTLDRVREVAQTGVDLLSVGALTHSARAVDLSLRVAS